MHILTIALALLCQDPVTLQYGTEKTKSESVRLSGTLEITVDGTRAAVDYVRMSHPIFSLQKVGYETEGEYKCTGKNRHKIAGYKADVEGMYDDEEYERKYTVLDPPENLEEDMFELIVWATSMGPHTFTRKSDGGFLNDDKNQDAFGEVLTLHTNAAIRMPEKPVNVGDTWTTRWTTKRKQKDNGGRFNLVQSTTLEKIEERNGMRVAILESRLTGELDIPEGRKDKSAKESWTKTEGRMHVELEIKTGRVLASKGEGKVHAYYQGIDPGTGDKTEVNVTFKTSGNYRVKTAGRKTPSRKRGY